MSHANGAKATRRHYTGPERLGYMLLALQTSTEQVAVEHHIPARTIRSWFEEEAGGIASVRRWLEAEMIGSYVRSRQAIFAEVVKRAGELSEDALMETYRKLATPAETPVNTGVVAMAKSEVHVHFDDTDA